MIRDAGAPNFNRSSRLIPLPIFFKSSAVTCGGGGGGGGGGGTISGKASEFAGFATLARCAAGGGGGTDSVPPPDSFTTPGPTSSSGVAFELSSAGVFAAAFPAVLSTLPKIAVIPSLTFFPAALPIALPAAEAPTSVIVWAPTVAATRNGITKKIRRIQYLIWQRNIAYWRLIQAKDLIP